MHKKIFLKLINDVSYIIIGCFFMAIASALFLAPNQLSTGGFTGISTIIYYFFGIKIGTIMIVLNIPLFAIAFFKINKELFVKSLFGTLFLSIFINFLLKFEPITGDRFLACIFGGLFMGIGTAIILKCNSSTGGTDLFSYIFKVYNSKYSSSKIITITDICIVFVNILFFREIEVGLYSFIAIFIMGKMIDIIFEGINFTKIIFIISDRSELIASVIGERVKRGSTGLFSKGMYSNENKIMLFCVGSRKEIIIIKQLIKKIDSDAFVVVTNAVEVLGKGFSKAK